MSKFNFNIDLENAASKLYKHNANLKSLKDEYISSTIIIDLKLPSGKLWCGYNLGVNIFKLDTAKDWYGNLYAWGELEPKNEYIHTNYRFTSKDFIKYTKYTWIDKKDKLEHQDDAAYVNNLKEKFDIEVPSLADARELITNTTQIIEENYNDIDCLNVMIFKSKCNNNLLIFPLAGCKNEKSHCIGYEGVYMLNRLEVDFNSKSDNLANILDIDSYAHINTLNRHYGMSIRPVVIMNENFNRYLDE